MSKSILISIQPKWVEKILNGEKTIEIRKTMPKCELPCKVYVYMTKKRNFFMANRKGEEIWFGDGLRYDKTEIVKFPKCDVQYWHLLGKVVACFMLKRIDTIEICDPDILINGKQCKQANLQKECQVSIDDIMSYIGYGDDHDGWGRDWDKGYLWHIEDLKIYDKPKLLQEFFKPCDGCDKLGTNRCTDETSSDCRAKVITRPPQSWCYVEESNYD